MLISLDKQFHLLINEINTTYLFKPEPTITPNPFSDAEYYLFFNDLARCEAILKQGTVTDTTKFSDYLNMMTGLIYFKKRDYKQADSYFNKINTRSNLFIDSILNRARSLLKLNQSQKAYIILSGLLQQPVHIDHSNSLNFMLGQILMHEDKIEFADNFFLNITIDSPFSNRAIIGKTLLEIKRNNYPKAHGLVTLLINSELKDLAADEAPLLKAYIYQHENNHMAAIVFYKKAVEYYTSGIQQQTLITNKLKSPAAIMPRKDYNYVFDLDTSSYNISSRLPKSALKNYQELSRLNQYIHDNFGHNSAIYKKTNLLHKNYNTAIIAAMRSAIEARKKRLNDYLDQANFSLLKLYEITSKS
ncbi:MAG: hypothetical protein OEY43_05835 [Gammaproteobacteria bacterium]|nr:hypothetical protein [Gammaproteobacteria bacterium]